MDQTDPPTTVEEPPVPPVSDETQMPQPGMDTKLRLFGIPVIYIVLILFALVIALLAWSGFVSGDML